MLAILLMLERMSTIRADKSKRFKVGFVPAEGKLTNLAQQLSTASGIVIYVRMGSTAARADNIDRYRNCTTGFYGF